MTPNFHMLIKKTCMPLQATGYIARRLYLFNAFNIVKLTVP